MSKDRKFLELCREAANCQLCSELAQMQAVLSPLNGSLEPKVFFIAEAPGRLGADRTRKPFYGDKSGENFQKLLDSVGLRREEIFITNSILCSPRTTRGTNRKPSLQEIKNCSRFLKMQIDLINPQLIVTLGSVALMALKFIAKHDFVLKRDVGRVLSWNGRKLIPLYHPSPQVVISVRSLEMQMADFQVLKKFL